jgi:hypothetical protein
LSWLAPILWHTLFAERLRSGSSKSRPNFCSPPELEHIAEPRPSSSDFIAEKWKRADANPSWRSIAVASLPLEILFHAECSVSTNLRVTPARGVTCGGALMRRAATTLISRCNLSSTSFAATLETLCCA